MLQMVWNHGGMMANEARMSSINTWATICSCSAFFWSSSGLAILAGSSSRLRSFDVSMSLSTTFCSVAFR